MRHVFVNISGVLELKPRFKLTVAKHRYDKELIICEIAVKTEIGYVENIENDSEEQSKAIARQQYDSDRDIKKIAVVQVNVSGRGGVHGWRWKWMVYARKYDGFSGHHDGHG